MTYVLAIIIGYALGNIIPAYFVGRKLHGIDIREHGSGNSGTTNAWRVLGSKPGIFVFIVDVLKGVIAVAIGRALGGQTGAILGGAAVILGHDYPILLDFKGGKGVATSIGVILCMMPWVAITCIIIGAIIVRATRYVSLASICGMIAAPIFAGIYGNKKPYVIMTLLIAALSIYRHRSNIGRLLNGTENKVNLSRGRFLN